MYILRWDAIAAGASGVAIGRTIWQHADPEAMTRALAAFFFSVINVGAQTMSRMTDIPTYIVGVMEGTALIVMLIFLLLTEYRVKWAKR